MFTAGVVSLVLVLLGGGLGLFPPTPVQAEETYFYSGGKKIPVRIATDRVAVRMKETAWPSETRSFVRSLTARHKSLREEEKLEEFPDQRIIIIPLREPTTREGLIGVLGDLRREPSVELVGTVVLTEPSGTPLVMTNELVLRFKENVSGQKSQELFQEYGLEVVRTSEARQGRFILRVKPGSSKNALEVANALYETGLVKFSHPNFFAKTIRRTLPNQPFFPDDTLFNDQWHLHNTGQGGGTVDADVDAPEAWDYTRGNSNVVIAVLDDGIQWNHPDLQPNVVPGGRDFTANPPDNDPSPGTGDNHGTAVSGVAAGRGNNNLGVSGSCQRCGLLPIRMLGGDYGDHADAFDYAVAQGASVITNSWGYDIGTVTTDDVVDAINNAASNGRNGLGCVILFAMTNTRVDNCVQPTPDISSLDSVIAVSRSTNQDLLGGGGFGDCMELIAPTRGGTLGITTTDRTGADGYNINGDYYDNFGGTSSATPLVAGIAGLLLSINPNLTRGQVQRILEETADKIDAANANYNSNGFSTTYGYGRVNAYRAVVPTVKISLSKHNVRVNEPFDVTVTATAPHGLKSLWWFGQNTGIPDIDRAHWQDVNGEPVYKYTWKDVRINEKGTFTLAANARDVLYPNPGDGYPHQASEGSGIDTTTVKVPLTSVMGLLVMGLTFLLTGTVSFHKPNRRL
jgi:subtilisin family serine protease